MRKILRKYKYPFTAFLVFATIFTVMISWHHGSIQGAREFYHLEKSENKAASEAFMEAQAYMGEIEELHAYFDYDSVIMKPLIAGMNKAFLRGKALLPKDSIEDILWWVFTYTDIYALKVPPRNDNSLAYDKLPPKAFAKVHDEVYEMIKRFPEGKLYFPTKRLKEFRFMAYSTLVNFFEGQYPLKYDLKKGKQVKQFRIDKEASGRLQKILRDYPIVKKKYLNDKSMSYEKLLYKYEIDMVDISFDILFHEIYMNHKKLPKAMCSTNEVKIIMKYSEELLAKVRKHKKIFRSLFDTKHTATLSGFGHIILTCSNLQQKARKIYNKIDQLNKENIGEKDEK